METNAKWRKAFWAVLVVGAWLVAVGAGPVPAYAQKPPAATSSPGPSEPDIAVIDAQRGALDRFLDAHPEIQNDVIGRPALISDPKYVREHPEVQAFLDNHPLVKADPRAFVNRPLTRYYVPPSSEVDSLLRDVYAFSVFICILLAVIWVVRTLVESRRWNRSFKMHEELHAKLVEKFASSQDFNAYLQSDTGRRLLEWTPPVPDSVGGLPNTIHRILWSLQAGVILFLVGLGLLVLRAVMDVSAAPALTVFGTLGMTLGAGFILSALISYGLSKHLGLIGGAARGSDLTLNR